MTERQLRKASRLDLLKLLLEQRKENEALAQQISDLEKRLQRRQIDIDQSGTLAEAALKLRGIFEAAETACQYYTENIRALSGRQEKLCYAMEQETREKCERMVEQAKQMSRVYWDEYTEKCNYYMKTMENARRGVECPETEEAEVI